MTDLTGRTALVTGANSGIGRETALALARRGAHVLACVRGEERAEQTAVALRDEAGSESVVAVPLDLANLDDVADAASRVRERVDRIDLLVNNAGVMMVPTRRTTAQGIELQIGVNHLGHMALTAALLDAIAPHAGARIVTVSSVAHKMATASVTADLWSERGYSPTRAYAASKLANLLFAFELERRLRASGASAISVAAHPGYTRTNLQHAGPAMNGRTLSTRVMDVLTKAVGQPAAAGAWPTLMAATDPTILGGEYCGPSQLAEMRGPATRVGASSAARDRTLAERLWTDSERIGGFEVGLPAAP
jgi:NAD(P)-dependent dehydrogenase (short-subunit alcohol dehydrogenase family)